MRPGFSIHVSVISAWAKILNSDELYRAKGSGQRLFCSPVMLVEADYKLDENTRLQHFTSNMESLLAGEQLREIHGVELVFIPMISHAHYYLLCFNLKTSRIDIIDNSAVNDESHVNYNGLPEIMRDTFSYYLSSVGLYNALRLKGASMYRLAMPWRTTQNSVDCGVFLMRHMETYKGSLKDWACGLVNEFAEDGLVSASQQRQLDNLRIKYVVKMLLSDQNRSKVDVVAGARRYGQLSMTDRMELDATVVIRINDRLKQLD